MPSLILEVDGRRYIGWKAVSVSRALEAAAGSFHLSVSDRAAWPIAPGAACRLILEGEQVLAGFVDLVSPRLTAGGHEVAVAGRDRTADLVDSSSLLEPGEWLDSGLARIAHEIAAPFGVSVAVEADAGEPFLAFGVQPGESAFEAIERAARLRGLLATTDGSGDLVLTRPSGELAAVALVEGENVLEAGATLDLSSRFGRYVVRGQHPGGELLGDELVTAPQGEATDALAREERTLLVIAEGAVTPEQAAQRAAWEATVRAARSTRASVLVRGWAQRPGAGLWRPNLQVDVSVPTIGLEGRFLIAAATWSLSESSGTTTELELVRPDAYTPQPELGEEGDLLRAFLARHGLGEVKEA